MGCPQPPHLGQKITKAISPLLLSHPPPRHHRNPPVQSNLLRMKFNICIISSIKLRRQDELFISNDLSLSYKLPTIKDLPSDDALTILPLIYCNFRTFTRTADYPQRSIFVVRGKNAQQITRTGLLPAPQNQRKSCDCIIGTRTHKFGAMNIPWVWIPLKPQKHFLGLIAILKSQTQLRWSHLHFIPCFCLQSRRSIAFSAKN